MRPSPPLLQKIAAAALVLVVAAGCSKSNTVPLSREAEVALDKEAPPTAGSQQIEGPVPASLDEAYQEAENVFSALVSSNSASDTISLTDLKSSLKKVRADLNPVTSARDDRAGAVRSKEDLIDSGLASLDGVLRAHNWESAKRQANGITMSLAELAGMYASPVPGELMMLRYYSRQIDIAASADDKADLKEFAGSVRQTWSGLRPAVEAYGGVAEARRFSDALNDLEKSGPPSQLMGAQLRDRIDEIQAVMKR